MQELIIDGKTYISSKRAAEITGYARDYVGQLCREGHVTARLVGRSWYVLEDSIRAHRFGEEEAVEVPSESVTEWESPRYVPESAPEMPKVPTREQQQVSVEEKVAALSDMQEAWKDWFEKKQEEILDAAEDIAVQEDEVRFEAVQEDEETSIKKPWAEIEEVVMVRRREAHVAQEPVQMQDIVPVAAPAKPVYVHKAQPSKKQSSFLGTVIVISIASLTVLFTLVATGHADTYIGSQWRENPVLQYLGGKSVLEK